jgi:hypothetical protein
LEEATHRRASAQEKLRAVVQVKLAFADQNRAFFRIYVSEWSGFEWTVKSAIGATGVLLWRKGVAGATARRIVRYL